MPPAPVRRLVGLALLVAGCGAAPATSEPLALVTPEGFPPLVVPDENPTTTAGVALGRQLYYDERLSPDGSRACADCHLQERSFSSPHAVGVLAHINLAWSYSFLWNGSTEGTLEDAMRMEVEEFFETDVARLREPDLEAMFLAAFGTEEVTTERAALALAQFQRTLVSDDSRFDRALAGDEGALDAAELRGQAIFYSERGECFHCHATRLLTDNLFHNNGLDAEIDGTGRGEVTGDRLDDGKFKTPTLRNIAQTGPYMHDDRFATLEEVVDFYSDGLVRSRTVDPLMIDVSEGGPHYSAQERADLVAFLKALSDERYLTAPELADPEG